MIKPQDKKIPLQRCSGFFIFFALLSEKGLTQRDFDDFRHLCQELLDLLGNL